MTRGKKTCKILKEIRQQIAEKNDIKFVTAECGFQGECKGTCPKCEEEVRYLENELRKRQQLGKVVTIAGISLGVAGTFAACNNPAPQDDEKDNQIEDTVTVAQHSYSVTPVDSLITEQPTVPKQVTKNKKKVKYLPDIKSEFPGGMQAFVKFFYGKIEYPQDALDEYHSGTVINRSGTVVVEFEIKADGTIGYVQVIKKVHPSLDKEAVRVVKSMPQWTPASSNGKAVASYYQLPVQYHIKERKPEYKVSTSDTIAKSPEIKLSFVEHSVSFDSKNPEQLMAIVKIGYVPPRPSDLTCTGMPQLEKPHKKNIFKRIWYKMYERPRLKRLGYY